VICGVDMGYIVIQRKRSSKTVSIDRFVIKSLREYVFCDSTPTKRTLTDKPSIGALALHSLPITDDTEDCSTGFRQEEVPDSSCIDLPRAER